MSLRKRPGPRPAGFIDAHFGAEPAGGACPSRVPSLDSKSSQNEKPRDVIQPRWGVYALRKKAERIGSVDARDEEEAVKRAFKEYNVARGSAGASACNANPNSPSHVPAVYGASCQSFTLSQWRTEPAIHVGLQRR
jgi:hypothetical protein